MFFCSGALKSLEHWEFIKYHKLLLKIAFFALYSLLIEIDGKRWCWRDTVTVGTVPQCGPHSVVTVGAVGRLMPVLASQPQLMPRTMTSLSQLLFQHFKAKFLFFSLESTVRPYSYNMYLPHKVILGATGRIPSIHKFTFLCASLPIFMAINCHHIFVWYPKNRFDF